MSVPGGEGMCNQTGGDGGPHMRVPMPEDRFVRKEIPALVEIADQKTERDKFWAQFMTGQDPAVPDKAFDLGAFVDTLKAAGVTVQAAPPQTERVRGPFELVPTEFEVKELFDAGKFNAQVTVPHGTKIEFNVGTVTEIIKQCWAEFQNQKVTQDLIEQMARKALLTLNDLMFPTHMTLQGLPLPGPKKYINEFGLDWKREAERARREQEFYAEQAALSAKHTVPVTDEEKEKWGQFIERNVDVKGQMVEFFAYEQIGATIPHVGTVAKTSDPELMKALGDGIESGRVVMDGDTVVSIDGKPVETLDDLAWVVPKEVADESLRIAAEVSKEISDAMPQVDMRGITITAHKLNPDGSETVSMVFPGCPSVPTTEAGNAAIGRIMSGDVPKSGFEDRITVPDTPGWKQYMESRTPPDDDVKPDHEVTEKK